MTVSVILDGSSMLGFGLRGFAHVQRAPIRMAERGGDPALAGHAFA